MTEWQPCEIVHVEDATDEAELLREALAEFPGIHVRHVPDAPAALSYLQTGTNVVPDLILLDLNLGITDGRRLLSELKSDAALRTIPVIVWSGSSLEEDLELAYQLGANAYVVKPAQMTSLRRAVSAIYEFWCRTAFTSHRRRRPLHVDRAHE